MELGQRQSMNEQCDYGTWNHAVQALDVLLGNATLCANFVDEARNKLDHGIGHITVLRLLKSAFCVKALCNASGNAAKHMWKVESSSECIQNLTQYEFGDARDHRNRIGSDQKPPGISVFAVCTNCSAFIKWDKWFT